MACGVASELFGHILSRSREEKREKMARTGFPREPSGGGVLYVGRLNCLDVLQNAGRSLSKSPPEKAQASAWSLAYEREAMSWRGLGLEPSGLPSCLIYGKID